MLQTDKVTLKESGGSYDGNVEIDRTGNDLRFKDVANGEKTLSEVINHIPAHLMASHADVATADHSPQYYNESRLETYLGTVANIDGLGISADVGGNTSIAAHMADAEIHGQAPKFVLRVAKSGSQYSTIQAAINAVPTTGPDAPAWNQWWKIEIAPGTYTESVSLNKAFVMLEGADKTLCRIEYDNTAAPTTYPLQVTAGSGQVAVKGLYISSLSLATGTNPAIHVGRQATLENLGVYSEGSGAITSTGAAHVNLRNVEVTASSSGYGMVCGSSVLAYDCTFDCLTAFKVSVSADIYRCVSNSILAEVVSSQLTVTDCYPDYLFQTGTGNGASTISYARCTLERFGSLVGTATLTPLETADLHTTGNVTFNWPAMPRTLRAGYGADGTYVDFSNVGVDQTDFEFIRRINSDFATSAGYVMRIGDDTGAADSAEAVVLELFQNSIGTGNFLQCKDTDSGLLKAWVDRDGKYHGDGSALTLADSVCKTLYANTAASAEISNFTAATAFDVTHTLAAGTLVAGGVYEIYAAGRYSVTGTPTITLLLNLGGLQIAGTGGSVTGGGAAGGIADGWSLKATVTILTAGASGTFATIGDSFLRTLAVCRVASSRTIDTTAAQVITATCAWSAASASNAAQLTHLVVKRVK